MEFWGFIPDSAQQISQPQQPPDQSATANPSAPPKQTESDQGAKNKENDENDSSQILQFLNKYSNALNAISTLTIAIFTIALFYTSKWLWKSGEKHSERELRAYVYITKADIRKHQTKHFLGAKIEIINAGQTPAYDLSILASFDFHEIPRSKFESYIQDETKQSRGTLGPGVPVDVPLYTEIAWTPERITALQEERYACFLYGTINYTDAFGKPRFTDFRYIASKDAGETLVWQVCKEGNDSN